MSSIFIRITVMDPKIHDQYDIIHMTNGLTYMSTLDCLYDVGVIIINHCNPFYTATIFEQLEWR